MKKAIYNVDGEIIRDYENREVNKAKMICTVPMTEYIACFPDAWSWKECDEWFFKKMDKDVKDLIFSFNEVVESFRVIFAKETYSEVSNDE